MCRQTYQRRTQHRARAHHKRNKTYRDEEEDESSYEAQGDTPFGDREGHESDSDTDRSDVDGDEERSDDDEGLGEEEEDPESDGYHSEDNFYDEL